MRTASQGQAGQQANTPQGLDATYCDLPAALVNLWGPRFFRMASLTQLWILVVQHPYGEHIAAWRMEPIVFRTQRKVSVGCGQSIVFKVIQSLQ